MSTIYRLTKKQGRLSSFDAKFCEALAEVLGVTDTAKLFEMEGYPSERRGVGRGRKRAA